MDRAAKAAGAWQGGWIGDMEKAERQYVDGEIDALPGWHVWCHMYDPATLSRDRVTYLRLIRDLREELEPTHQAGIAARRARDDERELAASERMMQAWLRFSPSDEEAVHLLCGMTNALYHANRISILHMRRKNPEAALAVIDAYLESPLFKLNSIRSEAQMQALMRRRNRARRQIR